MMRPKLLAAAVLLSVFVAGAVTGIFIDRHHLLPVPARGASMDEHVAAMNELRDELGLSEEQVAQIHEILAKHQQAVHATWEQLRPEMQSEMRKVHEEIAELLAPEQRKRFHEWMLRRAQEEHGSGRIVIHER